MQMIEPQITLEIDGQMITKSAMEWRIRIAIHKESIYSAVRFIATEIEEGLEIQLRKIERAEYES